MSALKLTIALAKVATWLALLPVLIGLVRGTRRPAPQRATIMWLAVSFSIGLVMFTLGSASESNTAFSEAARPFGAITGVYALSELIADLRRRRWMYLATAVYLVFWVWRMVERDFARTIAPYAGPALYTLLTAAALGVVWERIQAPSRTSIRDFGLVIGLGTVLIYAPGAPLETVSVLFFETDRQALMVPWAIRAALANVGFILLTLAFLWTIPPRSSSGPSPSAP